MQTPQNALRKSWLAIAIGAAALVAVVALPASAAPQPRPRPPAPTTTTTTAPTPRCGTTTIAKPGGGTWVCTFADEFSGTSLDRTKWVPQQTANSGFGHGTGTCTVDDADNVSVSGGTLRLTVRTERVPFTCQSPYGNFSTRYTTGMVSTWGLFSQAYGRFEIRARFPDIDVAGLQSALWLWPQDATRYGAWPLSGEIDIAEVYSQYNDRAIPYIHYGDGGLDPNVTNNACMLDPAAWHTYTLEWTTTALTISYDGVVCLVDDWTPVAPLTGQQPFDHPFIVAPTQGFGVSTNAFVAGTTPVPATTQVDYVRVWR